jgi:hypothetical protein
VLIVQSYVTDLYHDRCAAHIIRHSFYVSRIWRRAPVALTRTSCLLTAYYSEQASLGAGNAHRKLSKSIVLGRFSNFDS